MRIDILICSYIMLLFGISMSAQEHMINGTVKDCDGNPMEFVAVLAYGDSTRLPVGVETGPDGHYAMSLPSGEYTIEASLLGYSKWRGAVSVSRDVKVADILLQPDTRKLRGGRVVSSRINYTALGYEMGVKGNKFLEGLNLNDILLSAPGIFREGTRLSVYGRPVNAVYINKRKLKMRDDETLLNYLSAFRGKDVEKLEIELHPDGSGGTELIIHAQENEGGYGTIGGRFGGNEYREVINTDFNINWRRNKLSAWASGSYMDMENHRDLTIDSNDSEIPSQYGLTQFDVPISLKASVGIGYDLDKRNSFYADASFARLERDETAMYRNEGDKDWTLKYPASSTQQTVSGSVAYVHTFTDRAQFDADLGLLHNSAEQTVQNVFGTDCLSHATFHARYKKSFVRGKDDFRLVADGRSMARSITTEYAGESVSGDYDEYAMSLYSQYAYNFKRWRVVAGIKGEADKIVREEYFMVSPSISSTYYIDKPQGDYISVSWRKASNTPTMLQLSPLGNIRPNENVILYGNSDLMLSKTHTLNLSATARHNYTLSLGYRTTLDDITSYVYAEENGNLCRTFVNGDACWDFTAALYASFQIGKWCFVSADGTFTHNESEAVGMNSVYNRFDYNIMARVNHSSWSGMLWLTGGTGTKVSINATSKNPPYLVANVGRYFCHRKLQVSVEVADLLNADKRREVTTMVEGVSRTSSYATDSRLYQIRLQWNFNWGKRQMVKKMTEANREIDKRLATQ